MVGGGGARVPELVLLIAGTGVGDAACGWQVAARRVVGCGGLGGGGGRRRCGRGAGRRVGRRGGHVAATVGCGGGGGGGSLGRVAVGEQEGGVAAGGGDQVLGGCVEDGCLAEQLELDVRR